MKIIGITGGTGAGKTTALYALEALHAKIIDADAVYHTLTEASLPLRQELEGRFGKVYTQDGRLDRKQLGHIVFQNQEALEELNRITHRYVGEEIDSQIQKARQDGVQIVAIDAIELLESGLGARCDYTVAVTAPRELRIRRIMAREGISEEYARMRVLAQKNEDYYRQRCDYILESTPEDTTDHFSARALGLFQEILTR